MDIHARHADAGSDRHRRLTATTSLTVAEQLSLDETDLIARLQATIAGSAADDTVNLGSTNSLAYEETAHTVAINLADGTNHFEAEYVGYGAGEVFSYTGGSGTDAAIVHGQIAANDGSATFTMGDGTNSFSCWSIRSDFLRHRRRFAPNHIGVYLQWRC